MGISFFNLGFKAINSFVEFLFVFSEASDLHLILVVDAALSLNLQLEFMNSFLELHLILQKLFYFFQTVAYHNLKLFLLYRQYLCLSCMLLCSALLWWCDIRTIIYRARILWIGLSGLDSRLDVDLLINRQVPQNFILLFQLSEHFILSTLDFAECSWIWRSYFSINPLRDSLSVVHLTEPARCIFHKIVFLSLIQSIFSEIVLQKWIIRVIVG